MWVLCVDAVRDAVFGRCIWGAVRHAVRDAVGVVETMPDAKAAVALPRH